MGSGTTIFLERDRRRREQRAAVRNERKSVYAAFMAAVVRWQHEIVGRHRLRFSSGPTAVSHPQADESLQRIRQDAMAPIFELRMVGATEAIESAERIISFTYEYERRHEGPDPGYEVPSSEWISLRDDFIDAVRTEILTA